MNLTDLCLPALARFKGRVLVSRDLPEPPVGTGGPSEIWWLKLDATGTAVLGAGRLRRGEAGENDRDERRAQVTETADGLAVVAYLLKNVNRATFELRVAHLDLDEETGGLRLVPGTERTLADGCLAVAPVFSADARWVSAVLEADPVPRPVRHFAVAIAGSKAARGGESEQISSKPARARSHPPT
jgi:hypothetical protein